MNLINIFNNLSLTSLKPIMALSVGSTILLVILAVIVLLVLYVISIQRRLVNLDEMTKNSLGQIAVQVNSRWDALTQLAKATVGYAKHESDTLLNVIRERRASSIPADVSKIEEQNAAANSVLDRLFAVAESYPDLKAESVYREMMANIDKYENNVRVQRMVYNDAASRMNSMVRMFPSNIVARQLGFTTKEYFQEEAGKSSMPDLNL